MACRHTKKHTRETLIRTVNRQPWCPGAALVETTLNHLIKQTYNAIEIRWDDDVNKNAEIAQHDPSKKLNHKFIISSKIRNTDQIRMRNHDSEFKPGCLDQCKQRYGLTRSMQSRIQREKSKFPKKKKLSPTRTLI